LFRGNYLNGGQVMKFEYQLLGRLRTDCEHFLGFGNGNERRLWAGSVEQQIAKMEEIYSQLPEKPEWLTLRNIEEYGKKMRELKDEASREGFDPNSRMEYLSSGAYSVKCGISVTGFNEEQLQSFKDEVQAYYNENEIAVPPDLELFLRANEIVGLNALKRAVIALGENRYNFGRNIDDFCFSIECQYQQYQGLDEDDWGLAASKHEKKSKRDKTMMETENLITLAPTEDKASEVDIQELRAYVCSQYGNNLTVDEKEEVSDQIRVVEDAIERFGETPFAIYWGNWPTGEHQRMSGGKVSHETEITKDNIHLYYEFMDTSTKIKFSQTALNLKLHERSSQIAEKLNLTPEFLADHGHISTTYYKTNGTPTPDLHLDGKCLWWDNASGTIDVSYFGVKDNLRPIDEYIAEIKQSPQYKEYLQKNLTNINDFCSSIECHNQHPSASEPKFFEQEAGEAPPLSTKKKM